MLDLSFCRKKFLHGEKSVCCHFVSCRFLGAFHQITALGELIINNSPRYEWLNGRRSISCSSRLPHVCCVSSVILWRHREPDYRIIHQKTTANFWQLHCHNRKLVVSKFFKLVDWLIYLLPYQVHFTQTQTNFNKIISTS